MAGVASRPGVAGIGVHGREQIADLIADAFEYRARQLLPCRTVRQTSDGAARAAVPVGCTEADKGRHEIDRLLRVGLRGKSARLEAGLTDERSLLVTCNGEDENLTAEMLGRGDAQFTGCVSNCG